MFWPRVSAQTLKTGDFQLDRPGLSITGVVGTVYSIEYFADFSQTNKKAWRCLAFLQMPTTNYLWFDPDLAASGGRSYRAVPFSELTNMVFIRPGVFRMGSPTNETDRVANEGPQSEVTIRREFCMAKYLAAQGEYLSAMGTNPSAFTGDLNQPVEGVSWSDATNYCGRITVRERAAGRIAANSVYRLPSEAEWEYACRAGTTTSFSYGEDPDYSKLAEYAWYKGNSRGTTHPVGQKLPNPWGLYDMNGNVFQWCQDLYSAYPGGPAPYGRMLVGGTIRVFRGGLWAGGASFCRSAYRGHSTQGSRSSYIGFRVVLAPYQ